jgi:poly(beta-D-mannuronate) lyase
MPSVGWCVCVLGLLLPVGAARAEQLRAPFDVAAIRAARGVVLPVVACPPAPPPVRDMVGVSFYTDADHSVTDPGRLADDNAHERPVRGFLADVERLAERWVRGTPPRPADGACVLAWLDAWARAGAMLGVVNQQGGYEQEWTLGGLALTWLEVRDAPGLDAAATQRVLGWFGALAAAVRPRYDRVPRPGLTSVLNNHAYWAGLAVAAAGIARDDRALFDWGIARLRIGIGQIDADGGLPLELGRGRLALHYHLFALEPLLALNEMAHANGIDAEADGKLARLVGVTFAGARDPVVFARLSGVPQVGFSSRETADAMVEGAALEIWLRRHPDPATAAAVAPHRPFDVPWLGGDVSLLYGK